DDTTVFRPSGTFVDPGRFDEMAITTLAVGIAAAFLLRGRWRWLALGCALTAAAAVWISAGRTGLVEGLTILIAAGVVLLAVMGRTGLKLAALVGALVAVVAVLTALVDPTLVLNRARYYLFSLSPF